MVYSAAVCHHIITQITQQQYENYHVRFITYTPIKKAGLLIHEVSK